MSAEPSFDWCSFFALFWNDKGIHCKINLPDTVLFRYGQCSAWWSTNKDGYVQRHASQATTIEAIRKRFIQVANEDEANYSKFTCISRHGDGRPQLLRPQAFNQLCELLSDRLECGHPDTAPEIETPSVLQAFIQPYQDVRYVTTLINDGKTVSCHSFQRKYSRRYAAMSATTAAAADTAQDTDVLMGGQEADARRAEADHQMGPVDPALKMQLRKLTAHLARYIQRAHNLTLAGIVCEYIRDVSEKVYLLSVLRTEWASNAAGSGAGSLGAAMLLSPTTDEVGAEAAAALMVIEDDEDAAGEEDWGELPGTASPRGTGAMAAAAAAPSGAAADVAYYGGGDMAPQDPHAVGSSGGAAAGGVLASGWVRPGTASGGGRPLTGNPSSRPATASSAPLTPTGLASGAGNGGGATRSSLAQLPGGGRSSAVALSGIANTWPSLQHEAQMNVPGSPLGRSSDLAAMAAERQAAAMAASSSGLPPHRQQYAPKRAQSADLAGIRAAAARGAAAPLNGRPMSSVPTGTARTSFGRAVPPLPGQQVLSSRSSASPGRRSTSPPLGAATTAVVSIVTASGAHVNAGPRGAPLLIQQLQREVEQLRDELLYQHELAEASAAKIRQLEQEKAITTGAFSSRSSDLSYALTNAQESLEAMRQERDAWRDRAEAAEARVAKLEESNGELQKTLSEERGTVMKALKEFHVKESERGDRTEQLEAEVLRLSEQLKAEAVGANALKRQLLQYSDIAERYKNTIKDGNIEPGMEEGEEYAVQKVLSHYQSDLRAVFLYYAQLDASFAEHWPPSLTFSTFMLYCKDSQTSDMRAGARIRSNMHALMLSPAECETVFARYSRADPDAPASVSKAEQLLPYEMFLAALVHLASKLVRPDVPFLSEGVREYILKYVGKADRVETKGAKKGQLRAVLEGTARGSGILAAAPSAALSAGASAGGGIAAERTASTSSSPAANGKRAGKAGRVRSALPSKRTPAGGEVAGVELTVPRSPVTGERLMHSPSSAVKGGDRPTSAIMRELTLLGLDPGAGVNKEPIRRGGGFDLPC